MRATSTSPMDVLGADMDDPHPVVSQGWKTAAVVVATVAGVGTLVLFGLRYLLDRRD